MQTINNVTLYKCDYCSKKRQTKLAMNNHEPHCRNNPNNKHKCFNCEHLQKERGMGLTSFTCTKLNIELYSYKAEQKKLIRKYPEDFEGKQRMPLECPEFRHYVTAALEEEFPF